MMGKRILLLYISEHSGHHCASLAIEKALHNLDRDVETLNINSFNYTNPILEKVINKAYMSVVKNKPEIWDYLYDNPRVLKKTQKLREIIHKFNTGKLDTLLKNFRPDVIVCTQAFPCGMVADYKKSQNLEMPLMGVLTDYAPHSYWIYNNIDVYVVPSMESARKLVINGIEESKIRDFGIPIDSKFREGVDKNKICEKLGLDPAKPIVLIMGGTQGLGPLQEVIKALDRGACQLQMLVASGTNEKLNGWIESRHFKNRVLALGYAKNIDELMHISSMIITKPGGITTAEALAKGIPMVIVNPLPGQEAMNTRFLLMEGVAVKAEDPDDIAALVKELLYNKNKLDAMRQRALALAKPDSSLAIAGLIFKLADK